MEWYHILQAILSLMFVIGLLLLTLWSIKFCEQKGLKCKFFNDVQKNQRLKFVEKRSIDAKNQLVIMQADDAEYLLLIGSTGNLLLKTSIISGQKTDE